MAHPLSAVATPFLVHVGGRSYWPNCAWDALGVAAMVGGSARIEARCGDCAAPLDFEVVDGRLRSGPFRLHFAVPARRWWEDIAFTCKTMLLFRSDEHVRLWCQWTAIPWGESLSIGQGWELARELYGDRLSPTWTRKTPAEFTAMFRRAGLTSSFWDLG
jgi:hypothetical protein